MATTAMAWELSISRSKSLARRRLRPSQPKVHPTSWDDLEPFGMRWPFHNLEPEPCAGCSDRALIAGVGKKTLQPRELSLDPTASQCQPITILDIGRMHHQIERQGFRRKFIELG